MANKPNQHDILVERAMDLVLVDGVVTSEEREFVAFCEDLAVTAAVGLALIRTGGDSRRLRQLMDQREVLGHRRADELPPAA